MSNISPVAANRISTSEITGTKLLEMFKALEAQMKVIGADGHFAQMQFVGDPSELNDGDVIPEIHLSLRTYHGPLVARPTEFTDEE